MSVVCPRCGEQRTADESAPASECPRCGMIGQNRLDEVAPPPDGVGGEASDAGRAPAARVPTNALHGVAPGEELVPPSPGICGQWRLAALVLALLVVVAAAALTTRSRSVTGRAASWSGFPYDIRGVWEGHAIETIELRDRPPYEAEYSARLVVDDRFRLVELQWTAGHFLLKKETVHWQWPATIAYTSQRRGGLSESFVEPPQGHYTQIAVDQGSVFLGTRQEASSTLPFLEVDFAPEIERPHELWSNGSFRAVPGEKAIEAVARGGIPAIASVELDPGQTHLELPEAAAALAFRPYLQGVKPWPSGPPADPQEPYAGLELEGLAVVDLPDITCAIGPVEARLSGRWRSDEPALEGDEGDWVELPPEVRIRLAIRRSLAWSARVVFREDGSAIVRLPNRDLEIPVERTGDAPLAQQVDP